MKEFNINGVISTPENVTEDQLTDEFIAFIDSKGYEFGGGIGPYEEEEEEGYKGDLHSQD